MRCRSTWGSWERKSDRAIKSERSNAVGGKHMANQQESASSMVCSALISERVQLSSAAFHNKPELIHIQALTDRV